MKLTAIISLATFSDERIIFFIPSKPRRCISGFPIKQTSPRMSLQLLTSSIILWQTFASSVSIAKPAVDAIASLSSSSAVYKNHSFNLSVPGYNSITDL